MTLIQNNMYVLYGSVLLVQMSQVSAVGISECRKISVDYEQRCGEKNIYELETLKQGECAEVIVKANSFWNATGIQLEKNAAYTIDAISGDYWCDASIKSDADGWRVNDEIFEACEAGGEEPKLSGFQKWSFSKVEGFRRHPDADWFELIGVNGVNSERSEFAIGSGANYQADKHGEFCAFANDLRFFYWNNTKELTVTIRRIE